MLKNNIKFYYIIFIALFELIAANHVCATVSQKPFGQVTDEHNHRLSADFDMDNENRLHNDITSYREIGGRDQTGCCLKKYSSSQTTAKTTVNYPKPIIFPPAALSLGGELSLYSRIIDSSVIHSPPQTLALRSIFKKE